MSDWRNGSNKDSGRNQDESGRKAGRPIPKPTPAVVPDARSAAKTNQAASQDWRGNSKKGAVASKSQDRTWTGRGRETPTSTSGLRKAILLAGLAIAISVLFYCYWVFVFKIDPRLPVIVSIAPDYTTLDLGQGTFRNHDFDFEQRYVDVLSEPPKSASKAIKKLEPDERFLEEVRKNDKWGEGWGIPSSGEYLLGGGPSRRVTAYFVSSLIARETSPEVTGSDIAEDGNSKEQWVLLTKDDAPFDPSTEKLLTVSLLLERIANRTAAGSLALVVLDVKPPTVVTNLGDLEFPKADLEGAFRLLTDEQKNKLCVCLPCDSGQESWYAPEFKSSVFAHFFWKGISTGFDNSDRKWTLGEFKNSLQKQVSQWVAQHRFAPQTPTFLMSDVTEKNEDTLFVVETTGGKGQPPSGENVRTLLTTRYQSLEGLWDDYASLQHCLYSNPLQYATIESGLIQMEDLAEHASDKAWTEFEGRVKEVVEELKKSSKFDRRVSLVEARQHRKFLNDSSAFSDSSDDECLKVWNRLEAVARNKDQGKWSESFKKSSLQEAIRECTLDPKRVPTEWLEIRLLKLIHESMSDEISDKSDGPTSAEAIAGLIRMSSNLSSIAFDPCVELSSWNRKKCSEFEFRFAESFDHFFANEWDTCLAKLATMQKDFDLFSEKCKLLKSAMRTRDEALWFVPHLLAAQMRMSRHGVSEEGKMPEVEEIGKLLQDAIALRDWLSDEQASIEGKLKSEAETKLASLKSKLTETFSEVVRKGEEDAETLPISRIALRWPLLSLDIRKSLHSRLATLYGASKDDNASSVSNQTNWSSLTPRQVGSDFRRKLRLEGSNLEASGGYYDRIVFNDPRYSLAEIEEDKNKSQDEPSARQMIYQETYRTRMVANAFGQRAITKNLTTKFWPWNSPDQMQAVNTASYNLLQTQRLCISRWGDSDLDNPNLQKLYFERMLTQKGSITKPFLPIVQMLPGFDQARSVLVELEKLQADALNRASQEVNGLGVAASLFPPKESEEVSPISLTIEPSDWTAYATLSIHQENSSDRIPFTESSPSSSMGYLLSNTKLAEAIPKKLDPKLVGSQLRLSVRGHYRKCDLRAADAVDSFEIESKSPTLASTVLVTASNAEPITLWVLLDCSGSMNHKNIFENAKSIAKALLQRVLELNEKEESPIKVGFIVFGRKPDANRPAILSESKIGNQIFQTTLKEGAAIGELVDLINLRWISPSGCTPLYDAIYTACEESVNDGRNWIVVISDGSNGVDLPREEKIDKETGKKILDPNAYYHNNGNKQASDVQAKVIQSKSKLFVYQYKNDDFYREATKKPADGGGPLFSEEQKAAFANANQELKDLLSRLPKKDSNSDSKLFYDSFKELESDLIALLPVSTVKITDSDGKQLGQEPFDTHTFGYPISIQVTKPTQATITVNSRGDTKDFPIWLTGGEKLVFKYSDLRGLSAIPFKDDKNGFGNSPFLMVLKDGAKSDIRVKATKATDKPYRLDIQLSKRGDVGETVEQIKFVRRPRFLIASISPAESSMAEAFWVCDHLFKPNTHYPIIQLPSIPWEQGNEWRSEELEVNVWLAEDIPKKAKRIQLDAGDQSDELSPFTCVRVDDRVTVKVAPGSDVKPGAERYFVLCNNDLKAVRTYVDGRETKIEFNVPESQPAELMVVTLKEMLAWESEGALKHYHTEKSLRFLK